MDSFRHHPELERLKRELYKKGCPDRASARILGMDESEIRLWRKRRGLPINAWKQKGKWEDLNATWVDQWLERNREE